MRLLAVALLLLALRSEAAPQRGIALGLFSEDAGWSYRPLLEEIAATGADHVELVVAWYLLDGTSDRVYEHPRYTAPREAIERTIEEAHALGLRVFLFPILRLERPREGEWRGTLRPRDRGAFFSSYGESLVRLAALAERTGVELLSIGSELSTLDTDRDPWLRLIRRVRRIYRGRLTYSGNWDHFERVPFYDHLDYAGLCGYFPLSGDGAPRDAAAVWRALRDRIARWRATIGKPVLFAEVGYLSQRGAAAWPWREGAREPIDLEEQRRCYAAFRDAWTEDRADPRFAGVYFWNWYGWGGASSGGYTPRGKPALEEIRRLFLDWATRK